MALNKAVFKTRALTALVFVAVMLLGLLWNHWSFLLLFSIIHFGCWWEYFNLGEKIYQTRFHNLTRFGLMLGGYSLMLLFAGSHFALGGYQLQKSLVLPLALAGLVLAGLGIFQTRAIQLRSFAYVLLGLLYISLSWGMMLDLKQWGEASNNISIQERIIGFLPIFVIGSIWINDTMAYIVGSFIGKTPFSKISPKKTWEGTIGGALLCVVVMTLIGSLLVLKSWMLHFAIIAAIAAVVGTLGDLLESKLKRMADVKDSGSFMPGHGGFLDRFDSLLLATPIVWCYTKLVLDNIHF
jgi:phosphatidate cytidylyltransferase